MGFQISHKFSEVNLWGLRSEVYREFLHGSGKKTHGALFLQSSQLKHVIHVILSTAFLSVAMYFGKCFRWLITFSMFAFAVQSARPGVASKQIFETWSREKRKCQDFGAEEVKKKWYHRQRCHCQVEQYPSKGCGQIDESQETQTFLLAAAHPTCRCINYCQAFKDTVEASDFQLPQFDRLRQQRCYCAPKLFPSKRCGEFGEVRGLQFPIHSSTYESGFRNECVYRSFRLATAEPSCTCLTALERSVERSTVVKAAAVRFCAAVVETSATRWESWTRINSLTYNQSLYLKELNLTPELCEEVLTGTLKNFSTSQKSKDLFGEANALSEHTDTKGFGRLDPLFAPPNAKKYEHMLHVCRDEWHHVRRL